MRVCIGVSAVRALSLMSVCNVSVCVCVFRDKLLLHIIILSLSLNCFVLDINTLAADLKNTTSGIVAGLAKEAGCRLAKDGAILRAELSAPLVFPKMKVGSSKK